jgi:hypothetical protein
MKKIFAFAAVAAALLFAGNVNAQMSVNVGYAPQTYKLTSGSTVSTELDGFFAGINYNNSLGNGLGVSVGVDLRFNTKESKDNFYGVASQTITKTQLLVDVPVLFNYTFKLNKDLSVSPFVGPTFSLGLTGKSKSEGNIAGWGGSKERDWYDENGDNRKRFDIAATFGLKVGFREFRLFGGYNLGLLNLSSADNTTLKGSNWFIGLGYCL